MTDLIIDDMPRSALDSIHEAALAITSELSLPTVLERIVNIACDLSDAQYGALGVPGPDGSLEQFVTAGMSKKAIAAIAHPPEGKGLLGLLLQPGAQTIRLRNLHEHPASVGFCEGHPKMTSFLGVPITSRGELLGNLYLCDKEDTDEFDEVDERLIEMLAAHAAVAIENARLYQQIRRLAVLEERERIGMDLHDGIIQSIYAIGLTLEYGSLLLNEGNTSKAEERLTQAINGLNTIIRDIRNYILDLRPQKFQGDDLEQGLRNLLQEFRANTLAEIDLHYSKELDGRISQPVASAAFHIVQEALANASKHAAATRLVVSVHPEGNRVLLFVSDNGRGFSLNKTEAVIGHGLSNMDMRARALGGRVRIESAIGEGTTVWAELPCGEYGA